MARIVLLMGTHRGHIHSVSGLVRSLKDAGHEVIRMDLPGERLPEADLFLISSYLLIESLVFFYGYNIRPVILTDYLRNPEMSLVDNFVFEIKNLTGDELVRVTDYIQDLGIPFDSLNELAEPLTGFTELILCPRELEIDPRPRNGKTFHIHAPIPPEDLPDAILHRANGKKVIYAPLEPEAAFPNGCRRLHLSQRLAEIMHHPGLSDLCLITDSIPRIDRIKNASLVITDGELSVIRESICHGVPVMLLPRLDVQYRHAALVEYHRLGISEDADLISDERLRESILYLMYNSVIRDNVQRMRSLFPAQGASQDGSAIINELFQLS